MRKLMLLVALASPWAQADSLDVAANSVMRLANKAGSVHLQHLRAAAGPGFGEGAIQRIETQLERLGQYPQQARLRATPIATGDAQQRQ